MSQDMNILENTEAKHKTTYQVMRKILKELMVQIIKVNLCFAPESK